MSTKIRLARHGRKGSPFYHVVIADSRAPRDGKYIEKVGTYNPNTNPATIDLNFDRALYWLQCGAQPTDTAKRILSYKGVMLKKHLLEGVKKGAFDAAAAEAKFEAWMKEKDAKVQARLRNWLRKVTLPLRHVWKQKLKYALLKKRSLPRKKQNLKLLPLLKKLKKKLPPLLLLQKKWLLNLPLKQKLLLLNNLL